MGTMQAMRSSISIIMSERKLKIGSISILCRCHMTEGKIDELFRDRRAFLRQATKDYALGGNNMLDDIENAIKEAKAELFHNLELASCLREESEEEYQKESLSMYAAWVAKWFGTP